MSSLNKYERTNNDVKREPLITKVLMYLTPTIIILLTSYILA